MLRFSPTGRLTRADEKTHCSDFFNCHSHNWILFLRSMFASFVNTPNIHVLVHHPFSTVHIALGDFCEIGKTKDTETNWLQKNVPRCVGMGQHFQHLPVGLLFVFFTQQRKLMGSSAQNSSGVHWCRRRVRFNEVPEKVPKVPEKVWEALVQSQVRFNSVPEKVPALGVAARFRKVCKNTTLRLLGIPPKLIFRGKNNLDNVNSNITTNTFPITVDCFNPEISEILKNLNQLLWNSQQLILFKHHCRARHWSPGSQLLAMQDRLCWCFFFYYLQWNNPTYLISNTHCSVFLILWIYLHGVCCRPLWLLHAGLCASVESNPYISILDLHRYAGCLNRCTEQVTNHSNKCDL